MTEVDGDGVEVVSEVVVVIVVAGVLLYRKH